MGVKPEAFLCGLGTYIGRTLDSGVPATGSTTSSGEFRLRLVLRGIGGSSLVGVGLIAASVDELVRLDTAWRGRGASEGGAAATWLCCWSCFWSASTLLARLFALASLFLFCFM